MEVYKGQVLQSKTLACFNEKIEVICNQHINCMQMYVVKSAQKQQFSLIKLSLLPPYILITLFICFTEQM